MIEISAKYRISQLDDLNLVIEELCKVKKKDGTTAKEWKIKGYYGNLKNALCALLDKKLFDTAEEELTLKDLVQRIEEAKNEIARMIKNK